jgi:hypothetical protein
LALGQGDGAAEIPEELSDGAEELSGDPAHDDLSNLVRESQEDFSEEF